MTISFMKKQKQFETFRSHKVKFILFVYDDFLALSVRRILNSEIKVIFYSEMQKSIKTCTAIFVYGSDIRRAVYSQVKKKRLIYTTVKY
jgi:hypothetical protein